MARKPEQIATVEISTATIMRSREFKQGVADVRAGKAPRFDEPYWDQWHYERGRQFGCIAPRSMPLVLAGRLNPKAFDLFTKSMSLELIP